MLELSLQTSFITFCSDSTLLVENINSNSLLEIQESNIISDSAFQEFE